MSEQEIVDPAKLADTEYTPPMSQAIPLGIQHVLAMFAGNVTAVSYTHLTLPTKA